MAQVEVKIESVLGGQAPIKYFPQKGQFTASIGIDPDMPMTDASYGISGALRPTGMAKFSGTEVTGVPLWFVTNPKTENTYLYANDGKVHTIDSAIAMTTALNSGSALTAASGNGAEYYDNYAYFATNTDVTRYGPLNGSPSLNQVFWLTTLTKTALVNTTYPTINSIAIPNHPMYRHTNNCLYFADVVANVGVLHFIKTTKVSVEGDTDSGSTYNALDFLPGMWPTAIEGLDTDLVIALVEGASANIKQTQAKLAFWDTTSSSYQKIITVEFPDPFITALKNVNGVLYVFSGNAGLGCRVSRYVGGATLQEVAYLEDTYPPFQGAVDHILSRVAFGGATSYPETSACVWAVGSRLQKLGSPLNNILKATSAGSAPLVTALKYVQSSAMSKPQPLIGWTDGTAKGLDKLSTTYGTSVYRSELFRIGKNFKVVRLQLSLGALLASNITITPKIYVDDESSSTTLTVINSTNFAGRWVELTPSVEGKADFLLELRWTGTVLCPVKLPIQIVVETYDRAN